MAENKYATWYDDYQIGVPEPLEPVGVGDYLKSFGSGAAREIANQAAISVAAQENDGTSAMDSSAEKARVLFNTISDKLGDSRSTGAKRAAGASFIPEEGQAYALDDYKNFFGLNIATSLPSMVVSGGAAILGSYLGPWGGMAAAAAVNGQMNAASVINETYQLLDTRTDDELRKVPAYAAYRDVMEEGPARSAFRRSLLKNGPAISAAIGALTSVVGIEGKLARSLGGMKGPGRLKSALFTGVGETVGEGAEEGTNAYQVNRAKAEGGLGEFSWRDIADKTLTGAAIGFVSGAGTGLAVGGHGAAPAPVTPPTDIVSGVLTPKAQAAKNVGKERALAAGSGVQVTTSPVGETEAAVLAPEQAEAAPAMNPAAVLAGLNEPVTPNVPTVRAPVVSPDISDKLDGLNTEPAAPAASGKAATVEETPVQFEGQFEELAAGTRQAVFVPEQKEGVPAVAVPEGFQSVTVGGKSKRYPRDTRGTYYFKEGTVTPKKIRELAQANKINELLAMGPATKADVEAEALATGEEPVALQKINAEGVATVQQGVPASAITENADAIGETMAPGDTLEVTNPQDVIAARDAGLPKAPGTPLPTRDAPAPAPALAPAPAPAPAPATSPAPAPAPAPVRPGVGPKLGRILEAITNKDIQKKANAVIAANLKAVKKADTKAEKLADKVAGGPANDEMVGQYTGKDKKREATRADRDSLVKQVFDDHPPTEAEADWNNKDKAKSKPARDAMVQRINTAVRKAMQLASERGITLPSRQSPQMSNENVWLLDAVRLLQGIISKPGRSGPFTEFTTKERSYRSEDQGKGARADRREGGDLAMRQDQGNVEEQDGSSATLSDDNELYQTPEQRLIAKEEADFGPEIEEVSSKRAVIATKKAVDDNRVNRELRRIEVRKKWKERAEKRKPTKPAVEEGVKIVAVNAATFDPLAVEKARLKQIFKDLPDAELEKIAKERLEKARKEADDFRARQAAKPVKAPMSAAEWLAANDPSNANKNEFGDPLPDEAQKVQDAIEGKTVVQVAKWLEQNSPRSSHRMVAKRVRIVLEKMQAAGVKFSFKVLHVGDTGPRGAGSGWRGVNVLNYEGPTLRNDVYIVGADATGIVGTSYEVVLHELVHAVTKSVTYMGSRKLSADLKIQKFYLEMVDVRNAVINHFNARAKAGTMSPFEERYYNRMTNALANPDEVLTWALTNEDMQGYLDGIDYKSTNQSFLKKIFQAIGEFFGITAREGSALEEVLRVSEKIFNFDENAADVFEARKRLNSLNKIEPSLESFFNPEVDANISSYVPELKDRAQGLSVGTSSGLRGLGRSLATNSMLGRMARSYGEAFGGAMAKAAELKERMAAASGKILKDEGGLELARESQKLRTLHGEDIYNETVDVLSTASRSRVNLITKAMAAAGNVADNSHLGGDVANNVQAKKRLPELQRRMEVLPDDVQDFLMRWNNWAKDEAYKNNRQRLENLLRASQVTADEKLITRILARQVTDQDKNLFEGNALLKHLDRLAQEMQSQGWYMPFLREGDYVASGTSQVTAPRGATLIANEAGNANIVQFVDPKGQDSKTRARAAALAWAEAQDLDLLDTQALFVDKKDMKTIVPSDDVNGVPVFRVTMQNQYTEFFPTEREAQQAAEKLRDDGYNAYHGLRAENPAASFGGMMPSQYEQITRSLQQSKGYSRLSDSGKAQLVKAMHEANVRLLAGNRFQHRNLTRRNVMGFNRELPQVIANYAAQSANYRAKVTFQPQIDEALKDAKAAMDAGKYDKDNVKRNELYREMETRLYSSAGMEPIGNGGVDTFIRRAAQLSFINKLAGPSFHIINLQEPWTTGLPMLAGRYGLKATKVMSRTYDLLGARGALGAGLSDTLKAVRQNEGFTDYIQFFKNELATSDPDNAGRYGELFDHLRDVNLLNDEAGMETNRIAQPSTNKAGAAMDKVDLIARQAGQAVEAINRGVVGLAAYQLEYAKNGGNHQAAIAYAAETIDMTMGNYSASNAPPIFNSRFGRFALQFKKFPQKTYYLLGRLVGLSLKGDTEAMKQFAGLMFTHSVVAGVLGLPLEPIKMALLAAGILGLTGFSYEDFEDMVRRAAKNAFGASVGEAVTRGIPRAFGIDTSGRQGLDSLLFFGQPKSVEQKDLMTWLAGTVAGAPTGTILTSLDSVRSAMSGDFRQAFEKAPLPKLASDVIKAGYGYSEGKTTKAGRQSMEAYGPGEALIRAVGFTPAREAGEREARSAYFSQSKNQTEARQKFTNDWIKARPDERARMWGKVENWNRSVPQDARLTRSDLDKAVKRRDSEKDKTILGVVPNKRTQYIMDEKLDTYNVRR